MKLSCILNSKLLYADDVDINGYFVLFIILLTNMFRLHDTSVLSIRVTHPSSVIQN